MKINVPIYTIAFEVHWTKVTNVNNYLEKVNTYILGKLSCRLLHRLR